MDRVPPDQSLASRSVVKSACIVSNGVCEAGWSEGAGRVTSGGPTRVRVPMRGTRTDHPVVAMKFL